MWAKALYWFFLVPAMSGIVVLMVHCVFGLFGVEIYENQAIDYALWIVGLALLGLVTLAALRFETNKILRR